MPRDANRGYRVKQFAEISGVTVRALHHYDRLGLLKPQRSLAGYREYSLRDLERLEQIVALKFIGIPLRQIKEVLDRKGLELREALCLQRQVLERKQAMLANAIHVIREAEQAMRPGKSPDAALLKKIIEVIEMQNSSDWTNKYYSEPALAKRVEGARQWSPELQELATRDWSELFHDIAAAIGAGEDPSSAKAQALGERWNKLIESFTGGDPDITAGLSKLWGDRQNWPAHTRQQMAPFTDPKICEFIQRVIRSRPQTN